MQNVSSWKDWDVNLQIKRIGELQSFENPNAKKHLSFHEGPADQRARQCVCPGISPNRSDIDPHTDSAIRLDRNIDTEKIRDGLRRVHDKSPLPSERRAGGLWNPPTGEPAR